MKVSAKTQYGLRAMIYLAKNKDKILPLKEISEKEGIPFDFLSKIVSNLERKKLIKGKKGIGGGYCLVKNPKEIKIGQIIEALEGKLSLVKCLSSFCSRSKICLAKNFWKKLKKAIYLTLNSITLEELIKK